MCSISRSIDKIGDSWSLLILRDLSNGLSKYEELKNSLEIPPATLSKRLSALVGEGLLTKEIYQDNPPRAKYVLTDIGKDFLPVLAIIMMWGNKHASPNGIDTQLVDSKTHKKVVPIIVDRETGKEIDFTKIIYAGGPANSPGKIKRLKERGIPLNAAK
jgi:DNA-binding HxlR family transcriptional regulator